MKIPKNAIRTQANPNKVVGLTQEVGPARQQAPVDTSYQGTQALAKGWDGLVSGVTDVVKLVANAKQAGVDAQDELSTRLYSKELDNHSMKMEQLTLENLGNPNREVLIAEANQRFREEQLGKETYSERVKAKIEIESPLDMKKIATRSGYTQAKKNRQLLGKGLNTDLDNAMEAGNGLGIIEAVDGLRKNGFIDDSQKKEKLKAGDNAVNYKVAETLITQDPSMDNKTFDKHTSKVTSDQKDRLRTYKDKQWNVGRDEVLSNSSAGIARVGEAIRQKEDISVGEIDKLYNTERAYLANALKNKKISQKEYETGKANLKKASLGVMPTTPNMDNELATINARVKSGDYKSMYEMRAEIKSMYIPEDAKKALLDAVATQYDPKAGFSESAKPTTRAMVLPLFERQIDPKTDKKKALSMYEQFQVDLQDEEMYELASGIFGEEFNTSGMGGHQLAHAWKREIYETANSSELTDDQKTYTINRLIKLMKEPKEKLKVFKTILDDPSATGLYESLSKTFAYEKQEAVVEEKESVTEDTYYADSRGFTSGAGLLMGMGRTKTKAPARFTYEQAELKSMGGMMGLTEFASSNISLKEHLMNKGMTEETYRMVEEKHGDRLKAIEKDLREPKDK